MLFVPAGEVNIGTAEGPDDVRLIHKVPVRAFYMDKCEVANAQFAQFLNASGGRTLDAAGYQLVGVDDYLLIEAVGGKWRPKPGMDRFPMVSVTWYGAAVTARWAGKGLPTYP